MWECADRLTLEELSEFKVIFEDNLFLVPGIELRTLCLERQEATPLR